MQCASSITTSPAVDASSGSTSSRKPGLFNRSGETSSTSTAPDRIVSYTSPHCSLLALFTVTAWMPARSAAAIWLRINASNGEMITVGPAPPSRSNAVATKYTADLPHPVRCTTNARCRPCTRASTAVHWSSRNRASSRPTNARRWNSARSRRSVVVPGEVMTIRLPRRSDSAPDPISRRTRSRLSPERARRLTLDDPAVSGPHSGRDPLRRVGLQGGEIRQPPGARTHSCRLSQPVPRSRGCRTVRDRRQRAPPPSRPHCWRSENETPTPGTTSR